MKSKTSRSLIIMMICVVVAAAAQAQAQAQAAEECSRPPVTVEAACRDSSETHAGVVYEHCVASLSNTKLQVKSTEELAVVATKLAIDHAASTASKIEDLSELEEEAEAEAEARGRFNHCLEQYGGAADLLRDALDNLKARIYGKAMEQLAAALGASESCEDAWKNHRRVPVAAHDREYGRMAHIALGFTHAAAA